MPNNTLHIYVKAPKKVAERIKKLIMQNDVIDRQWHVKHRSNHVLFPVVDITSERVKKLIKDAGGSIVYQKSAKKRQNQSYYDMLKKQLSDKEFHSLVKGYDLLGNIALISLPDELKEKSKIIANTILKTNKNIKTVLAKSGPVSGIYRIRKLKYIAGKRNYIAEYMENGCKLIFDVRKTFFSSRLSYERSRISSLVKDGERVMVMFAGVGPFAVEIAKKHKSTQVIGIELNKYAYRYMKENIKINKLKNVKAVCGDVREKYKDFVNYADRVVMPLPKMAIGFIKEAVAVAKNNAVVHIYSFCKIGKVDELLKSIVKEVALNNAKATILNYRKVRPYSAKEEEIVIDFKISKKENTFSIT